jgi:nicotinamidase-related amidase
MPVTQLDPKAALIVIDLQKFIVSVPAAHPTSDIIANSAALAQAFRARNLPVVLVNVDAVPPGRTSTPRPNFTFPPDWADLIPELDQQPSDLLITKKSWGAFLTTDLDQKLRARNVTQIFLTGISTTAGVESTARSAYDHGYHVVIVTDATTDRSLEAHTHAIETIFPRLAELDTTANILKLLTP